MKNLHVAALCVWVFGGLAQASNKLETVVRYEAQHGRSGYVCNIMMHTDAGTRITFQLSDYKSVWRVNIYASNRAAYYKKFESGGLSSSETFKRAHPRVLLGERAFKVNQVVFPFIRPSEISPDDAAGLKVMEKHNVVSLVSAMSVDHLSVPNLLSVAGLEAAFGEFQSCALDALGVEPGAAIETDYRADYRLMFVDLHAKVAGHASAARSCGKSGPSPSDVAQLEERASAAFYPSLFAFGKRGEFLDELGASREIAASRGSIRALSGDCALSGTLARAGFDTLEGIVSAAEELD